MNWEGLLATPHIWTQPAGQAGDVVISSRVRLARNIVDSPFPARLDVEGQKTLLNRILQAASQTPSLGKSQYIGLSAIKKIEREFLMERHLISPEMVYEEGERGVLLDSAQSLSVMINEEDHIRLQSFEAGLNLSRAWHRADLADAELGTQLSFAFDSEWGYCTRCPTNAGTGLRASCLLHMPALVMTGEIERMIQGLGSMGVNARGFYGERSKALGDLFQISNSSSLGQSEPELLERVSRVVESLIHYERRAREALMEPSRRSEVEDLIHRAWGTLRHARLISYDEAMLMLSRVRLGLDLGVALPVTAARLSDLMLMTQPAHVQLVHGSSMKAAERDRTRAELIRQKLDAQASS